MPVLRSKQSGDMYVQVVVETPQNLTKRQKELLAEFDRLSSSETQPEAVRISSARSRTFSTGWAVGPVPLDPNWCLTPAGRPFTDFHVTIPCPNMRTPCPCKPSS